mmetsp:Transcript_9281/g.24528  ORF Transcript_9281/g.24528 Transcript_9281/m.24528 type:complete len:212 (-) Transcript_9281:36-671(-)
MRAFAICSAQFRAISAADIVCSAEATARGASFCDAAVFAFSTARSAVSSALFAFALDATTTAFLCLRIMTSYTLALSGAFTYDLHLVKIASSSREDNSGRCDRFAAAAASLFSIGLKLGAFSEDTAEALDAVTTGFAAARVATALLCEARSCVADVELFASTNLFAATDVRGAFAWLRYEDAMEKDSYGTFWLAYGVAKASLSGAVSSCTV